MAKCLPFLTCLKSSLQQIINSILRKISDEHSTVSTVRLLNREERIEEIAKMLAGEDLTEAARQQAEQLLKR